MLNSRPANSTVDKPLSCSLTNDDLAATVWKIVLHFFWAIILVFRFVWRVVPVCRGTTLVSRPITGPTTPRFADQCDRTSQDWMEFYTYDSCTTRTTTSSLATACSRPESTMRWATPDVGAKSGSYNISLTAPTVTDGKEAAPSFRDRVLVAHTLNSAVKNMPGTVVGSYYGDVEQMRQLLS